MSTLRISIVQPDLIWENPKANLLKFNKLLAALKGKTDLVLFPEMFTTGFSMHPEHLSETMSGPTLNWMAKKARELRIAIGGSLIIAENGQYFNRFICMKPSGKCEFYDKRHLFGYGGEDKSYTAGNKRLLVRYKGWKICPLICYDLRFPVWSRNNCGYDLLIYVANWPVARRKAWKNLLLARAIENQAFAIGVNRCGTDGAGMHYSGDSSAIDFSGELLFQATGQEIIQTVKLVKAEMMAFREKLAFLDDQDKFVL